MSFHSRVTSLSLLLLFIAARTYGSIYPAKNYFDQAYAQYPVLPHGILEAVSWHQTRCTNVDSTEMQSCSGMPLALGYMGLITDGNGYFTNTAERIAKYFNVDNYTAAVNPQYAIPGYAHFLAAELGKGKFYAGDWKKVANALIGLSEFPQDGNPVNEFAAHCFVYSVFTFLNDADLAQHYGFNAQHIDLIQVLGAENYKVLSAKKIIFRQQGISNGTGNYFKSQGLTQRSAQYAPAIWNPAPSCNYSSRNGTPVSAITIHTVQGTYAGAISWAQNCSSNVSYHYVVRSSDGQITQMVDEAIKAWHVGSENPYTIGYEHEGYVSNPSWYTTALYTASADLSRDICNSGYGINSLRTYYGPSSSGTNVLGSCTKIKGHQHYPNQTHTDPGIYWDWEKYYKLINNSPVVTTVTTTSGSFYDTGGPAANYTNDERLLWLFAPVNATSVSLTFSQFDIEANWDYMFIYDGNSTYAPLIGVYTGTASPGTVTSSGGQLLVEFRSDCNTVKPGWSASYNGIISNPQPGDLIAPTTAVSVPSGWVTQDFTATFTDADNAGGSGIEKSYYQVIDLNNADWRGNAQHGFFSDNFDQAAIHPDWTSVTGTWSLNNGTLQQTDDAQNNTNIYAYLNHTLSNRYLYHWSGKMEGSGTNRRSGLHYFCDAPTLTNRGNSYFIWFRLDDDMIQLYKVVNDVFTLVSDTAFNFNAGQWYDYKLIYDRVSGKTMVYIDNSLKLVWTDSAPYPGGDYVSFRSGNSVYTVDNFKVFRSRAASVNVQVGPGGDLRYQNANPYTPAGRIKSITNDNAGNISAIQYVDMNVDTTAPPAVSLVNDGFAADIDTFYNNTTIQANWTIVTDTHSAIARYWFAIGTAPGATDVMNWTDNAWYDSISVTGLSLVYNTLYYVSVKAENGAGLLSTVVTSDGMLLLLPSAPPVAAFNPQSGIVCSTDSVYFNNGSSNAVSYQWTFPGGNPATSTLASPAVYYAASGTYNVSLVVNGPGGSDTLISAVNIIVNQPPAAAFTVSADTVYLPGAFVGFSNQSSNADGYGWDFGDGGVSNGNNPWHQYTSPGIYTVEMIASSNGCVNDTAYYTLVVLGGSGIPGGEETAFGVYPNPANDIIFISGADQRIVIDVFDVQGKQVLGQKINLLNGQAQLSVGSLAPGMYRLRISQGENTMNKPVLIWR